MQKILALIVGAALSVSALALPKLPDDPQISRGVLDDGISYCLVANPSVSGLADVALIQKGRSESVPLQTKFLSRKGIAQGKEGYIQQKDDNLIYHFPNLPVAGGDSYVDSLLLSVFRIIEQSSTDGYGTANQTIVIAGDIDRNAIRYKLQMLSLMVPKTDSLVVEKEYKWTGGKKLQIEAIEGEGDALVCFEYRLPPMPKENNNSVAALMTEQFTDVLSTIVKATVTRDLRQMGIPCKELLFEVAHPDTHFGDDLYSIKIKVPKEHALSTCAESASLLSKIVCQGVSLAEYEWAYRKSLAERKLRATDPLSNAQYMERCIDALLYNASLATDAEKYRFFASRELADTVRLRHFNTFAASLVEGDSKRTISLLNAPVGVTSDSLANVLSQTYGYERELVKVDFADTLLLPGPTAKKSKAPQLKQDAVTGGTKMTYPNGISLTYKKMTTGGVFHYSWLLRGGQSEPLDLQGATIAGLKGDEFLNLLSACGMTVEIVYEPKNISLEGTFYSERLALFIKAMQAIFAALPELGSPAGGMLMLIGDRTEYSLQKCLQQYMDGFDLSRPGRPRRSVDEDWVIDNGDSSVVYQTLLKGDYLLSAEGFMTASATRQIVSQSLAMALEGIPCYAEVSAGFTTSPRDMFNLNIKIRPTEGHFVDAYEVQTKVRACMEDLAAKSCEAPMVSLAKSLIQGNISKALSVPDYILLMAKIRFAENKDIVSKYPERIAAVTPEKIRELFAAVVGNGFVESY